LGKSSGIVLDILLVEDNPGDVVLFKQALRNCAISFSLKVARDGEEAIRLLRGRNASPATYKPNVVFLDLNLPCKSGAEVLAEMKADPALAAIPVAILTGSDYAEDYALCARLGADDYLQKAGALQDFFTLSDKIRLFLKKVQPSRAAKTMQAQLAQTSAA
jgi:two-component system response regulator